MSRAQQAQLRPADYPDERQRRIFETFFLHHDLSGSRILELGPGQYDFARFACEAGATVVGMDRDPAVIMLGQKRGHEVVHSDFLDFDWASLKGQFDGLYCWASINPFWFTTADDVGNFIKAICSCLKPQGWGWLAPWSTNRRQDTLTVDAKRILGAQEQSFRSSGFDSLDCSDWTTARFAATCDHQFIFCRNVVSRQKHWPIRSKPQGYEQRDAQAISAKHLA